MHFIEQQKLHFHPLYFQNTLNVTAELLRWLFKYLKVDSIHMSSRSISAVIYLKMVGAQNHPTILSYRTFSSKESLSFFTTKHSVVKNVKHIL